MQRSISLLSVLLFVNASAQQPVGWASENGGTSGGAGGKTVTVTSAADFTGNAKTGEAAIIRVSGKITVDQVAVASNKTIEGAEKGATLNGSLVINGSGNIIIRNLVISKSSGSFEDVVQMQKARNVWIDHCDISDSRTSLDGLCDMTHACDYITVSWTKFSYSSNAAEHRFCMLISHSDDNEAEDLGKLRITLHHNWWADNITERMPRMRFCKVHAFNNYFSSKGNNYCIGAGKKAQVLVESNYFENVNRPHFFFDNSSTAIIAINGDNHYVNVTNDKDEGQGTCFDPPYDYSPDKGSEVKDIVTKGAGPQFGIVATASARKATTCGASIGGTLEMETAGSYSLSGRKLQGYGLYGNYAAGIVVTRQSGQTLLPAERDRHTGR